eukprot:359543-Chlamydomonas_euryale.AAC.10
MHACMRARAVRACVRVYCAFVRTCVRTCVRACVLCVRAYVRACVRVAHQSGLRTPARACTLARPTRGTEADSDPEDEAQPEVSMTGTLGRRR